MQLLVSAHDFYPDPGSGGTGRYVHETARRLADRGHDVSVLTRRRGDVPLRETVAGVQVARYDFSIADQPAPTIAAQSPAAIRAVRDHLDALPAPDLVSFQGTVTDPLVDLLVNDDVPRSATVHSPWPTEYRIRASHESGVSVARRELNAMLRERVERWTLDRCDHATTLSEFMAETLRDVHGPVVDTEVVPGGVDAERYRPDAGVYEPMAVRRGREQAAGKGRECTSAVELDGRRADGGASAHGEANIDCGTSPPDSPRDGERVADGTSVGDSLAFLTVRRLSPRMGHDLLLRAFARVATDHPDAQLYVAGDGPLRGDLERMAADLGIADRVTFLGYVPDEDLPSAYATADCFVLPTRRLEGFGLATLEALASGTPVVATPVGGTTEILAGLRGDDRVPAEMVVPSFGASALADRLAAWADLAPAERAAAGRACREHARENFSWERAADALAEQYATLI
ncbi:glycosyltransferase family 4 protein [Halorussus litoreus]|uniref:glycosyltransferase family 4 protein n=1 Tax=Halorussus litoreus TaxID=1710536 RepID=UPI0013007248|nr:glycosyltransferase family 4 protein [Halorussus litoreus]